MLHLGQGGLIGGLQALEDEIAGGLEGMDKAAGAGFAILTFLAHGETPASKEFGPTVQKALDYLIKSVYVVKDKSGNLVKDPNGKTVPVPDAYTEQTWLVPSDAGTVDVLVYNTSGCHVYDISAVVADKGDTGIDALPSYTDTKSHGNAYTSSNCDGYPGSYSNSGTNGHT